MSENKSGTVLLAIDVQQDFCGPAGALAVPGADADAVRLAAFLKRRGADLAGLVVTLDTHLPVHVAHPVFWSDALGRAPAPFTVISAAEVRAGRWAARRPEWRERALAYVETLTRQGRFALTIWPPHCLLGTPGHALASPFAEAVSAWQTAGPGTPALYVLKGSHPFTEHYSALRAEVPDPAEPSTQPHARLRETLRAAETVLVTGEALSHCVANTLADLADEFGDLRRFVLLSDLTSPVAGHAEAAAHAVAALEARGLRVAGSREW